MNAYTDRLNEEFEGSADYDRQPAFPKSAIVSGFDCYTAASRLASPYGMVQQDGRVTGDGDGAEFTALYNGRRYRVTVEPERSTTPRKVYDRAGNRVAA